MLKSSQLCKNLRKPAVLSHLTRNYNYQTELYAKKLELKDERLAEELKLAYKHRAAQPQLSRFIEAYHQYGVKLARLDPLELNPVSNNLPVELNPATYGLNASTTASTEGLLFGAVGSQSTSIGEIEAYLQRTYSSNMAIEFSFINNEEEKLWIAKEFEAMSATQVPSNDKIEMLKLLINSQVRLFVTLSLYLFILT
jgi:2-oxoglutarate dehydrogenase complex dehydrogenase (E1) component-like enzyme